MTLIPDELLWYNNHMNTHNQKLTLNDKEKQQVGYMIRWLRIQAGWTQQELTERANIVSLRTLLSLEHGHTLKDDEIYDHLLSLFGFAFNYKQPQEHIIQQGIQDILNAYIFYDDVRMKESCSSLQEKISPYINYIQEFMLFKVLQIFISLTQNKEYLTKSDYAFFLSCHDFIEEPLQIIMEDALYKRQYNVDHNNHILEQLYQQFQHHRCLHITRFTIGIVLHLSDKHHNYLEAFQLLEDCEQRELIKQNNPHALFDIYHWMSNLSIFIIPHKFEEYETKALKYMKLVKLSTKEKAIFFYNIGGSYYYKKQYTQALIYYQKAEKEKSNYYLPLLIWMCHAQFCIDQTLPHFNAYPYDVTACSKPLQHCWKYFTLKIQGADALTLETYIMKTLITDLITLAPEFHEVYHDELKALVKKTRNYKQLMVFEDKLQATSAHEKKEMD